jgi:hypothetical protein
MASVPPFFPVLPEKYYIINLRRHSPPENPTSKFYTPARTSPARRLKHPNKSQVKRKTYRKFESEKAGQNTLFLLSWCKALK